MSNWTRERREDERGSALLIATLVTVILSLLGISYLMMAQTENNIAENERNSAMALYVAETGARLAIGWFDNPTSSGYLVPAMAQVDRTRRLLDHDNDPGTPRVLAAPGDALRPLYKDASLTSSPIFDRPYRSSLADTFLGVETGTDPGPNNADAGPDLIVKASYLSVINETLFQGFPSANLRARIGRIEIYAPPIVRIGGAPTRMGIATIRVVSGVVLHPGTSDERLIAARVVKAVINQLPVPESLGPLQSCSGLSYNGGLGVHWGTATSVGGAALPQGLGGKVKTGLPYGLNDPFTYINGAHTLFEWANVHSAAGDTIEDPWLRLIAGGTIDQATNTNPQPWAFSWPGSTSDDHSNLFQHTIINCPTFDYRMWKSIAQSGGRNTSYFQYDSSGNFKLDGTGTAIDFRTATSGRGGILFFDTADGQQPNGLPHDDPASNLTPGVGMSGGSWSVQGLIYLNARSFETTGVGGASHTIVPPGEPGDASGFVNLHYPGSLGDSFSIKQGSVDFQSFQDPVTGDWWCTDAAECDATARTPAGAPVRDNHGLPFQASVSLDGVLYVGGIFTGTGDAKYYGSVVVQQGVEDGGGAPEFYFDEGLVKGTWPRAGMGVPRVVVSSWEAER